MSGCLSFILGNDCIVFGLTRSRRAGSTRSHLFSRPVNFSPWLTRRSSGLKFVLPIHLIVASGVSRQFLSLGSGGLVSPNGFWASPARIRSGVAPPAFGQAGSNRGGGPRPDIWIMKGILGPDGTELRHPPVENWPVRHNSAIEPPDHYQSNISFNSDPDGGEQVKKQPNRMSP